MLSAVHLDDQPHFKAHEVEDVSVQRHLPLELQPFQLAAGQRVPQHGLGLGGVSAHRAGELAVAGWDDAVWQVTSPSLAISST